MSHSDAFAASHALQLHVQVDALSRSSEQWPRILGALQHAYDACSFKGRAEMQLRLRRFLHECICAGGQDQNAWEDALRHRAAEKQKAEGSTWSSILTFAVSVENQYILAAVNRHFSLALKAPVVWEGHDVTFSETHF
eukprot:symbB.v1.2.026585.t1/scaffold2671.1/size73327/1